METKEIDSICGLHSKYCLALIASLCIVLCGCATTDDPRQGGFFSSLHALTTGAYEERLNNKQQELDEARSGQEQLKKQVIQSGEELADYSIKQETIEKRLVDFQHQMNEMRDQLDAASQAQKMEDAERSHLESEISMMQEQAAQISEESSGSNKEKEARLVKLENRKKELEQALKAALVF